MERQPAPLNLRSYQLEMLDRSLEGNVIVTMDTGSGKTHVALQRIMVELGRCTHGQLIWFLAPTVDLCNQQRSKIELHVPAAKTRMLTGSENVEYWSEQSVWDAALDKVQVVVSTPAILADALRHGFISMTKLALLIFDEAHHCVKRHPANVIMQDFYHRHKLQGSKVPHVLGLTASPIMGSRIKSVGQVRADDEILEKNLDASSVTPRLHRQDLQGHVHRPECLQLGYPNEKTTRYGPALEALLHINHSFDDLSVSKFQKKAIYVHECLGRWAGEYFITRSVAMLKETAKDDPDLHIDLGPSQRQRLNHVLDHPSFAATVPELDTVDDPAISPKVRVLVSFLAAQKDTHLNGIVFVEQRVTTSILCKILSMLPETSNKYRCAPFVGTSNSPSRRFGLVDLFDLKAQRETLVDFRNMKKNLIIATNVLEEGIDVQACNLVICFDPPSNLKAFIQRRGRARRHDSQWVIMTAVEDDGCKVQKLQKLEAEMEKIFLMEDREATFSMVDEVDEVVDGRLESQTTDAMLTPDSALQHIHHFCHCLPQQLYVDMKPAFCFHEENGKIRATVMLPNCLDSSLHRVESARTWKTERAATKDAAFQAYCLMFDLGLLNENLLPLHHDWDSAAQEEDDDKPVVERAEPTFDIWGNADPKTLHENAITINDQEHTSMFLLSPSRLPPIPPLALHWAPGQTFTIIFAGSEREVSPDPDDIGTLRAATWFLHRAARTDRKIPPPDGRKVFLVVTSDMHGLQQWLNTYQEMKPAIDPYRQGEVPQGLVRVPVPYSYPQHFIRWIGEEVECQALPTRKRFHIPFDQLQHSKERKFERFAIKDCVIQPLPLSYVRFGMFLPDILAHVQDHAMAYAVNDLLSQSMDTRDVLVAITAPSANRLIDYQRYEFVGDAVLKYIVSAHLFCAKPTWHEGFLTTRKAYLVSNQRLAKAALSHALDRYIITEPVQTRPLSFVQPLPSQESLPTKLLADVVEALIGASFLSSPAGLESARSCLNFFLPIIPRTTLHFPQPPTSQSPSFSVQFVQEAETLVGYTFSNKLLLLEALTHGSFPSTSYDRLEFLGDALLDFLVVRHIAHRQRQNPSLEALDPDQMTKLRAAVVNADFLGYICLGIHLSRTDKAVVPLSQNRFGVGTQNRTLHLWKFLRRNTANGEFSLALEATARRFDAAQEEIKELLEKAKEFPWVELTALGPEKVFSDLIESVLGAILVDNDGNFEACEGFLTRIGLYGHLDRILIDRVDVEHPKGKFSRVLGSKRAKFDVEIEKMDKEGEQGDEDQGRRRFTCRIRVEGEEEDLAEEAGCGTRDEAVARASREGCRILMKREPV